MGSEGIINCAATANANWNIDQVGDVPTACSSQFLIAVTNTDANDNKYMNAAYGIISIDIGAPGTNIYSTFPGDNYGYNTGYWENTKNEAIDTSTEWDLEIYDQMQILKTKKVKLKGDKYKINTSGWQGGMYFVRIKFKDKILSGKFLVNR